MNLRRPGVAAAAATLTAAAFGGSAAGASAATTFPTLSFPTVWFPASWSALPALPGTPALPAAPAPSVSSWPGLGLSGPTWTGARSTSISFIGPSVGQISSVIGPTIITTAPPAVGKANNDASANSNLNEGQVAP